MAAAAAADAVFDRLAAINPAALGARMPFGEGIPVLGFDDEAQAIFDQWRARLENSIRQGDQVPALESHLSKYRKLVPALALLDHLIVGKTGDIQIDSVKRALAWQAYLLKHARRAYAAVTSAAMDSAKVLSERIRKGAISDGFTSRELNRKNWAMLNTSKEAAEALGFLVDLGWLRAVQDCRQNGHDGCLHGDTSPAGRYGMQGS